MTKTAKPAADQHFILTHSARQSLFNLVADSSKVESRNFDSWFRWLLSDATEVPREEMEPETLLGKNNEVARVFRLAPPNADVVAVCQDSYQGNGSLVVVVMRPLHKMLKATRPDKPLTESLGAKLKDVKLPDPLVEANERAHRGVRKIVEAPPAKFTVKADTVSAALERVPDEPEDEEPEDEQDEPAPRAPRSNGSTPTGKREPNKGATLLTARLEGLNMSQSEFGKKIGIGHRTVSGWCLGSYVPTLAVAAKIEDAVGIPMRAWLEPVPA